VIFKIGGTPRVGNKVKVESCFFKFTLIKKDCNPCFISRSLNDIDSMQCTSYYRDSYENSAWQMYLRECAIRVAREEVAFLEVSDVFTQIRFHI
jgi:hypothetical protein